MGIEFSLVVATDKNGGIGKNGDLPWRLKKDMQYFKEVTTNTLNDGRRNSVIMGRATWESIPNKFRPLPKRHNIVLSRKSSFNIQFPNANVCNSINQALQLAKELNSENTFIIGGGNIYQQCVEMKNCTKLYITEINESFECDTFFPSYKSKFDLIDSSDLVEDNGVSYHFNTYQRITKYS